MRVVLVTGCSQGEIGWHVAKEFASKGCTVYASARTLESLQGLRELGCHCVRLDVTDEQQRSAAVDTILQAQGRIDILVNNAGLLAKAPVAEAGKEHFRSLMEVNFFGPIDLVQSVVPHMIWQQSGTIINVGSIASYSSQPFWAGYSAAKSALQSATDALRVELKPFGIRVVYCAPGFIATQLDAKAKQSGLNYVDSKGPYASEQVQRWVHSTDGISEGTSPEVFARGFVAMALGSAEPPAHYVSGKMAWIVWLLGNFMPYRLMDLLYAKASGLRELQVS